MERKPIIPAWLNWLLTFLCFGAMAYLIWSSFVVFRSFPLSMTANFLLCIALLAGLLYCFDGFGKHSARNYRLFCILFLISCFVQPFVLFSAADLSPANTAVFALSLMTFGAASVLTFATDLGKAKSLAFVVVLLISVSLTAVTRYFVSPEAALCSLGAVLAAVIFLIMVVAKYADKAARGSR